MDSFLSNGALAALKINTFCPIDKYRVVTWESLTGRLTAKNALGFVVNVVTKTHRVN